MSISSFDELKSFCFNFYLPPVAVQANSFIIDLPYHKNYGTCGQPPPTNQAPQQGCFLNQPLRGDMPPGPGPLFLHCVYPFSDSSCTMSLFLLMSWPSISMQKVLIVALDGHRFSNTRVLNKCLGWTGLLIEANINNYRGLVMRLDRPGVEIRHSAVCERPQRWANFIVAGGCGD